jgi:hypothetical protein
MQWYAGSPQTPTAHVPHVIEEVVDVREEFVVGEGITDVCDEASSRARALPKNLIALLSYTIRSSAVLEDYCPD